MYVIVQYTVRYNNLKIFIKQKWQPEHSRSESYYIPYITTVGDVDGVCRGKMPSM